MLSLSTIFIAIPIIMHILHFYVLSTLYDALEMFFEHFVNKIRICIYCILITVYK